MAHVLRDAFAGIVDDALRQDLISVEQGMEGVVVPIVNTKYEGDVAAGAVKIPYRADMVAGDYDKAAGIAASAGSTAYITVTNFNDKAVNEIIDGYEADAVPDDLIADRLASAGYAGALAIETDFVTVAVAEGTTVADTTESTSLTAYEALNEVRTTMSKNKIPSNGRYALVSPDFYKKLLEDTKNFVKASDSGQLIAQNAFVGRCAGFYVFEHNGLPADVEFITGHSNWFTRVRAWVKTPDIYNLDGSEKFVGASAVKGRWVFKHKVTKALAVMIKKFVASIFATGISLTPATFTKVEGTTQQMTVTFTPANTTNKNVVYQTSNSAVATVDVDGLVTAVGAGTAIITATSVDGNFSDTAVATITEV